MRCMHPLALVLDGIRQFVPCGKCNFCLEARRSEWSFRLRQELKVSDSAYFLTMTYADDNLPRDEQGRAVLRKKDVQLFIKRLRKACVGMSKVRYYAVGEYGTETSRPHYHCILFNVPQHVADIFDRLWIDGNIMIGSVTDASIHYVTKYHVNAVGESDGRAPPFSLMSRKPGLGSNYLVTHTKWHLQGLRNFTEVNGFKGRIPRYYREKMFKSDGEWIVDKEELLQGRDELVEYLKEVKRLEKLHSHAVEYYNERKRYAHDIISHKSKQSNKF